MTKRRVVITGMGILCPIGNTLEESWKNALAGTSGAALIDSFDTTDFTVKIAATVKDFDVTQYIDKKSARRVDPFIHYGMAAGIQAVEDAGISEGIDKTRVGVAMGSGIGGVHTIEATHQAMLKSGPRRVSPFFVPSSVINMLAGHLSMRYGFQGPNFAVTTSCATGSHNIGLAMRSIQHGDADIMLAGGAEVASTPLSIAGFAAMRALSTRNDDPEKASRPWDKDRDGFVLGDGAGALVLEEYEHAKARGAKIYCELAGFGMSADASHITAPPEDGAGALASMQAALGDATMKPSDVGYINAHGTSTPQGDIAETVAIKRLLGEQTKVPVSSSKSMVGHLLGAAGAVESIFTILALRDQILPPTINLEQPGEGCDLDYVPNEARKHTLSAALSNSFGFGGTNTTLAFRKLT